MKASQIKEEYLTHDYLIQTLRELRTMQSRLEYFNSNLECVLEMADMLGIKSPQSKEPKTNSGHGKFRCKECYLEIPHCTSDTWSHAFADSFPSRKAAGSDLSSGKCRCPKCGYYSDIFVNYCKESGKSTVAFLCEANGCSFAIVDTEVQPDTKDEK